MSQEQVPIRIAHVKRMLEQGKTRDEIGEFYGISKADVRRLFRHEELKGKKSHKKPGFRIVEEPILEDDRNTAGRENSRNRTIENVAPESNTPEVATSSGTFNYGNREPEI